MGGVRYRGLFYKRCAHPPNRPKTPTRSRHAGGAPLLLRATHRARGAHPRKVAALTGRAVSVAYGHGRFCAVSGATRPRPLCLRKLRTQPPALSPPAGLHSWRARLDRASAPADNATNSPLIGERLAAATRERCPQPSAAGFLCGVGGYSPPSALLELPRPVLPQWLAKHAWLFSTAPHISWPAIGGPRPRGRAHALRPSARPSHFRLLPLIRLPPAAIFLYPIALRSLVSQRVRASLARFSFLALSATAARWAAGGLPVPPPPSLARLVVAPLHAPPSLPWPRALRAPVFRLRALLRNRGLSRPRSPRTSLSPAGSRPLSFASLVLSLFANAPLS